MSAPGADVWTVAANGLRVIELPVPGRLATSISIALPAGSRHERADEIGAAHLLEHLAFKGTVGHPTARELNRAAERLGTELNAQTGEEHVEFFTLVRAESAMELAGLLVEVCGRPLLPAAALEGERGVVLAEIADEDDDPATSADDRLAAALFPGHRLATRITGAAADVERLTHAKLVAFRERQWSPQEGVAVVAGNLDHIARDGLEELLSSIPGRPSPPAPPPIPPFARRIEIDPRVGETAHLRLGYQVEGYDLTGTRERAIAEVYSQLLGGPMGSRLHEELREERGLCYGIDGYVWGYPRYSGLAIDLSLQAGRVPEAYAAIDGIVADLRDRGPTAEEAHRARAYALGSFALSFDGVGARAAHALEAVMGYGDESVDPLAYLKAIESVTRGDLVELAGRVAPGPCVGCAGPVEATTFGVGDVLVRPS
jgi:predicted Zn-dependent peptidase